MISTLTLEELHRKLRFGWDLVRMSRGRWYIINREERVLHPVGKVIKLTPGTPNLLQRKHMLRVLEEGEAVTTYNLAKSWNRAL